MSFAIQMKTMLIGTNPAKVKSTHKSECFSAGINPAISRTYYHKIAYEINKKKGRHIMDNYERALELVNKGIARRHHTFDATGYITLDLGGEFVGYISPKDVNVDIAEDNTHIDYGYIDLEKMEVVCRRDSYPIEKWK